tara:strand:- start:415 stop:837 length:423 start_codon:yes stop_codon:yes gene_type:complete
MSSLTDQYSKNFSPGKKKEFERRVSEMAGNMSELAAIQLVLAEMFQEGKKDGGPILKISPYLERRFKMYKELKSKGYKDKMLNKYLRPGEKELFEKYRTLNAKGGLIDKPLGSGGVKSGPPPKRGPNPQGLNVPLKQVKT